MAEFMTAGTALPAQQSLACDTGPAAAKHSFGLSTAGAASLTQNLAQLKAPTISIFRMFAVHTDALCGIGRFSSLLCQIKSIHHPPSLSGVGCCFADIGRSVVD